MHKITLIMAYYLNAGMLRRQFEWLDNMPQEIKDQIELIVVDDCSPVPAMFPAAPPIDARLYRTKVDVAWNQDFCRNLAVSQSSTEWLLLTDIDHIVPPETWASILADKLNPHHIYRFSRREPDGTPYKIHPNTWLMTKAMYERAGGYDERFAGYYGTDGDFRDRVQRYAPIVQREEQIIRVGREHVPDASTTTLERKKKEDGEMISKIKRERGDARPVSLSFEWERVV